MPPSISRTPDFSNQIAFPLEVREIGILLYFDDSKSILAEIKGEDITSDSDNDEDELEILSTFALAFVKEEK